MDEMALLERFRDDVQADPRSLLRARRRVLRRAVGPAVRRRVLVGAAVVAGIAATVVIALPHGPGMDPAAAAVLERAAKVTATSPTPTRDQYLHVRGVTTRWYDGRVETVVQESWIPGDPTRPRIFRDSEGMLYRAPLEIPEIYDDRSLTVPALLEWLRRPSGDLTGDDAAYERAGEVLADDTAPLPFKADLFAALRHVEGVRVLDAELSFADRPAVLLGRDEEPLGAQFAFDRETGAYLGMQGAPGPGSPDRLSYRTVDTVVVVEHLPARARIGERTAYED